MYVLGRGEGERILDIFGCQYVDVSDHYDVGLMLFLL